MPTVVRWQTMLKKRKTYRIVIGLFVVLLLSGSVMILLDKKLTGVFLHIAEVKAVQLVNEAVQASLQEEKLTGNINYHELIVVHKDNEGGITLIRADALAVNKFASNISVSVQRALDNLRRQSFRIPLGQVLDIPVFSNKGPKLKYSVMQVGSVRFTTSDSFETAGINQTRHTIYLNLEITVRIVASSKSVEKIVSIKMPLTESIIVGRIPETFITFSNGILGRELIK
jgi:sporulation protein YunB